MEQFLQFIFVLAIAKYCIDAALTRRVAVMAGYALVLAAVAFALWPTVIGWRGDMIADLLSDGPLVADAALIITVEAVAGIFISVLLLDNVFDETSAIEFTRIAEARKRLPKANYFMPKEKRRRSLFVLKVLPGVICFFAAVYFELLFFRSFVGVDFLTLALSYAGIVAAGVFLLSAALGWLMPGESTKLEAKIVLDMAILFMGLFVNASIASYNVSSSRTEVSLAPLVVFVSAAAVMAALGFLCYKVSPSIKKIFHGFHK